MAARELSFNVVGAAYPNKDGGNRRTEITFCDRGEALELRPEPKNPHDEHAIAVFSARQFQIGYVASARTVLLKKLISEGHQLYAVFQDVAPWGAVARLGIDAPPGELPEPLRFSPPNDRDDLSQLPEEDFYPDEPPPDD